MEISERLTRYVGGAFPRDSERVLELLGSLPDPFFGGQDVERLQAALVIEAGGRWESVKQMEALAATDWRDALMAADLADGDWPLRLIEVLGEHPSQ